MGEIRIKGRINEWGNSIAIRVPKIAILKDLIAGYKPEQDHPLHEVTDEPKGNEVW